MTADLTARPSRLTPPLTRQRLTMRLVIIGFIVLAIWAWRAIDMSPAQALDGIGAVGNLLGRMLPPNFADFGTAVRLSFETLWMAVIGTAIATTLSIPLAFGAARNTTPHRSVQWGCRAIIVASRAVPDLLFAAIFMRVFGIGVLPGILALGLHSIGMLGKLFADAIEQVDETPREAVTSVGAGKWSTIITAVVPQVMPSFIGTALYRLDINLRAGAVLGWVGAGGIGVLLKEVTGQLDYDRVLGVIIVMFAFLIAIEFLSAGVRATLIGDAALAGGSAPRRGIGSRLLAKLAMADGSTSNHRSPGVTFDRDRLTPPWTRHRKVTAGYAAAFSALIVAAFVLTAVNPVEIITAVPEMWDVVARMVPPDFTTARDGLISGMIETIAIAVVATLLSVIVALPLGLLAARNTAVNRIVYGISRLSMIVMRGVPELIFAVIFIVLLEPGPMAGVAALVVGVGGGFLAKLFADSIEEVDPAPREAVIATGATRIQETGTAVLPQALPALIGNSLYVLDINLRAAAVLGIVGAGGIGTLLQNSLRVMRWETTAAIILSIFVLVYVVELLSGWIRKQIL